MVEILGLNFAAFFAPQPHQKGFVVAHDHPGIRAPDEKTPIKQLRQFTSPSCHSPRMLQRASQPRRADAGKLEPGFGRSSIGAVECEALSQTAKHRTRIDAEEMGIQSNAGRASTTVLMGAKLIVFG